MKPLILITWDNRNDGKYEKHIQKSINNLNLDSIRIREFDSISKAYNSVLDKYKDYIRCYIHSDVEIIDLDFVSRVQDAFLNYPNTGFIGVAGNIIGNHGSWWTSPYIGGQIYHHDLNDYTKFGPVDTEAFHLDSLFMATDKPILFPDELPGIHFSDLWACNTSMELGYTNRIVDIKMLHFSEGERNSISYLNNYKQYCKKWFPGKENETPP